MRLSVTSLRRMVKRPLPVEFGPQQLTSYSGLELLRRYLRLDLTRLRGHPMGGAERSVHDAEESSVVSAGVPAADR